MNYLVVVLYLVAFALFIYGLMGLTGPKTAVRGNWIAAAGMARRGDRHADLDPPHRELGADHRGPAGRCGAGRAAGAADQDDRDAAAGGVFNGVGGGTVALIALSEFIDTNGFSAFQHGESPTAHIVVASLFAAIIGSISFWGSIIAFGKLQEILPGRPIGVGQGCSSR